MNENKNIPCSEEKLCLPTCEGLLVIQQNEISYIHSYDIYCYVYNCTEKHFISMQLKQIEKIIDSHRFFRCHRSYIVNVDLVNKYVKGSINHVVLKDGKIVPVARSRKKDFENYLRNRFGNELKSI